ncbi:hypothetical protein JMJ35_007741 [Cladonia borealis]|uniref:PUM-HD domain-containing protein n=1 Tax=Cladonia borealis TaxID=184061 RepID=A0AA39QU81_9LECA|nr:hypothetical protein JMJ35_007741 [Cladonia borealis]
MAGIKRKGAFETKSQPADIQKKLKKEGESHKLSKLVEPLEAETDSDPIIESDTTSQSGEDDGVSWPSDNEVGDSQNEVESWEGASEGDGGVEVPGLDTEAENAPQAKPQFKSSDGTGTGSSKEAHAKQKVERQERKAAKPNADSIAKSKKLWERLRRKSHVPLAERKTLVAELFDIITGRVKDFVFKHDSVRVIQTALKYANVDQRKSIARELKGEYKTLAQSKYAKFLIGKMLVHGDYETRDLVVPEFYGHIRRMMKHPEASWIVDDIYRGIATTSQKANMLREWYGAEYALFISKEPGPVSADLKELLAEHPEKRTPIMRSLLELINLLVQKKTTGFTMLHDAMLQYFLNVQHASEEMTEFIELLKGDEEGDLLKNLAFTKSGARLVCLALAHSNAKDRKHILRTYKDTMQTLAYDTHGHKVLLAVYDVIDDTVLVSKSVFPELVGKDPKSESQQQDLLAAATHLNARIPLLYPFCGKAKSILSSEDFELLDEVHRIRTATSKKDPEVRSKELVASLSPALLSLIVVNPKELVSTSFGCQFVTEVILGSPEGRESALEAIATLTTGDAETKNLLEQPAAGRMLKTLVLGGRYNPKTRAIDLVDPPLGFHNIFFEAIKHDIVNWAIGDNSFVVVGLLEAPGFSGADELLKILKKGRNRQRLVEVAGSSGMGHAELKKKKKGNTGIPEQEPDASSGNKGTQILLKKLDTI